MEDQRLQQILNLTKIPDAIKSIPSYEGDPKTLSSWIQTVESTLELFIAVQGLPVYPIWVQYIRNKIVGKANETLQSNHVPNDWNEIRDTLITYFGDRRDLSTLILQIPYNKQGQKSLTDFYGEISALAADIHTKIQLDPENNGHVQAIMRILNILIRDSFIDGLNEPYSSYTRNFRPEDLREAYQCAAEQLSADKRKNKQSSPSTPKTLTPPRPPLNQRRFSPQAPHSFSQVRPFQSSYQNFNPNRNYQQFNSNFPRPRAQQYSNSAQIRNPNNRPQHPRPTPMEIDNSGQFRMPTQNRPYFNNWEQHPIYPYDYEPLENWDNDTPEEELSENTYPQEEESPNDQEVADKKTTDDLNFHLVTPQTPTG